MATNPNLLITGVGVLAPNGKGKEEFWASCIAGRSGIKPITLFDTGNYVSNWGGEIRDLVAARYLGDKGLRNLDRTTVLALVSAKMAIDDADVQISTENADSIGVVLGSTTGSVHSISSFDIEGLSSGPRYVNPAKFPNTVINSPASQIGIRFGITGLNSTIGTGFTAGLNALEYSVDMLNLGRVHTMLVGGVEELCPETYSAFQELASVPFGRKHGGRNGSSHANGHGVLVGEGAGILILENDMTAKVRGAQPYAELLSVVSAFAGDSTGRLRTDESKAGQVIHDALDLASIRPRAINCVSIGGCTYPLERSKSDFEGRVLKEVLGEVANRTDSVAIRPLCGETFSASGILQVIASLGFNRRKEDSIRLIVSLSPIGSCAAAVLRVFGVDDASS